MTTNIKEAALAVIGFGANLEDPREMIGSALAKITELSDTTIKKCSQLYLTKPQGGPAGQDWYHNGVVIIETALPAQALMISLLDIEHQLGRVRKERWGPRSIDLDLLFYGDLIMDSPELILPHPRIEERAFVLVPLEEIAPSWPHPLRGLTAREMLAALSPGERAIKPLGPLL